ncbi:hypothetical protein WK70_04530 [Burkholderia cepacia]|nr:hypothetical protein WK70_04530 [Burkholderia cepacia]
MVGCLMAVVERAMLPAWRWLQARTDFACRASQQILLIGLFQATEIADAGGNISNGCWARSIDCVLLINQQEELP